MRFGPPSAKQLREKGDLRLIERHGALTGEILLLFGFNLNLAPVVDVSYEGDLDNSLKNRTWGLEVESVTLNAGRFQSDDARAGRAELRQTFSRLFPRRR